MGRIAWIIAGGFEALRVDNVQLNAGTGGATLGTDDVGGVQIQRTKNTWGPDGTANDTDIASGKPMPVQLRASTGSELALATAAKQPALGTAGASSADVLSVQGIASGTAMPVSVAALPLPSGAATETTLAALNTKTATAKTSDYDTGAGTDTVPMVGIALPASGGAVQGGTATNPVRTDPTGTTAQPITDNGGNISVDDGGGSLTIDAPVGTPAFVRLSDGAAAITTLPVSLASVPSHAVTNAGTFAVQTDGSVASGSADSGNPVKVGGKYNSSPITLSNGQRGDLQMDSTGAIKVAITSGAGSGGTSIADKAAFTEGSTSLTPVGGVYNETISADPTEDQAAAFRITAKRALHVNLRDASGNELAAGNQYAEDAPHTSGDLMTMAGVVRRDTAASSSGTDGDISTMNTDASGRLWVNASGAAVPVTDNSGSLTVDDGAGSLTVDNAGTFAVQAAQSGTWTVQPGNTANTTAWKVDGSAVTQPVSISGNQAVNVAQMNGVATTMGNGVAGTGVQRVAIASDNTAFNVIAAGAAAHNAALSGNPVRIGARAVSADYIAATTGNTADIITDLNGKQIVLIGSIPENFVDGVTAAITGTGDTSVIATSGAGIRTYINQITVTNSHATVGTLVEIKDGSTVRYRGYAAPAGGGFTITLPTPLRGTANTAWNAANITTGSNTYVSMAGYKAP